MSGAIEREFKLLLPNEAALQALREALGGPCSAPRRQVNHFFDTPARDLRAARIGLRLREEEGVATLTLKGPELAPQDGGGAPRAATALASREEAELVIEAAEARAILAGRASPLEHLRASALAGRALVSRALELAGSVPAAHLGSFTNERVRVGPLRFPPGTRGPELVFELDRTHFPGGRTELELELELPAGADAVETRRALEALFERVGIALQPAPSKLARFLRYLEASRGRA